MIYTTYGIEVEIIDVVEQNVVKVKSKEGDIWERHIGSLKADGGFAEIVKAIDKLKKSVWNIKTKGSCLKIVKHIDTNTNGMDIRNVDMERRKLMLRHKDEVISPLAWELDMKYNEPRPVVCERIYEIFKANPNTNIATSDFYNPNLSRRDRSSISSCVNVLKEKGKIVAVGRELRKLILKRGGVYKPRFIERIVYRLPVSKDKEQNNVEQKPEQQEFIEHENISYRVTELENTMSQFAVDLLRLKKQQGDLERSLIIKNKEMEESKALEDEKKELLEKLSDILSIAYQILHKMWWSTFFNPSHFLIRLKTGDMNELYRNVGIIG